MVEAGGNRVEAKGLDTGDVSVKSSDTGAHVKFESFSLQQLKWDALAQK